MASNEYYRKDSGSLIDLKPEYTCKRQEQCFESELRNDVCYMCNGYYGPNFGEPVCATCHAFLFPDYASTEQELEAYTEKSDDADSGNDEPADALYMRDGDRSGATAADDGLARRLELLTRVDLRPATSNPLSADMQRLPPEVLLSIFAYLDDWSLWSVANVCSRWQALVRYETPGARWRDLTHRRFPLYRPLSEITSNDDWFDVYSRLMSGCCCLLCVRQMGGTSRPRGTENSWRRNRLRSEMKIMRSDPPDGIQACPLDPPACFHWQATIAGPAGSPYEGGVFLLYVQVPYSYPMSPPVVRFITRIYHPNVSRHGDIGIDSIQHNWSLALTISKVLISVQSLLTDPYCEICMEPDIGQLYCCDRDAFDRAAQQWTCRYAMFDFTDTYCHLV